MWISLSERCSPLPTAMDWGIVNKVVPRDQLEAEHDRLAQHLTSRAPVRCGSSRRHEAVAQHGPAKTAFVLESMAEALSRPVPTNRRA